MLLNKYFLYAGLIILFTISVTFGEMPLSKFGVLLGNPWLGIKYNVVPVVNLELRTTLDPEVNVIYLRGNYTSNKYKPYNLFCGLEYGSIRFNMEDISGNGSIITPFIGAEYIINKKLSLSADFGYGIITLNSDNVSLAGPEYIFNLWLTLYPFTKETKETKPSIKTRSNLPLKKSSKTKKPNEQ